MTTKTKREVVELPIEAVKPNPANIRDEIDSEAEDLKALAHEVKVYGIVQPLVVFPAVDDDGATVQDRYMIADGHRRVEAAKAAGLATVPAIVKETEDAAAAAVQIMLTTGRNHKVLNRREEARGIQQLLDLGVSKTRISKEFKQKSQHVEAKAKITAAPEELQLPYYTGAVDLEGMIELQKLEAEDPELHEQIAGVVVNRAQHERVDVTRHIAQARRRRAAARTKAELEEAGAKEAAWDAPYSFSPWIDVTTDKAGDPLPVAEHVAQGHQYRIDEDAAEDEQLTWYKKPKRTAEPKPEVSEQERAERKQIRELNKELSLTAVSRDKHMRLKLQQQKPAELSVLQRMLARRIWREAGFWSAGGSYDPDDSKAVLLEEITGLRRPQRTDDMDHQQLWDEWVQWRQRVLAKFTTLSMGQLIFVFEYISTRTVDRDLHKAAGYRRVLDKPSGESGDHFGWRMDYLEQLSDWGWVFDEHEQAATAFWAAKDNTTEGGHDG
ncbi:ParB/RepB/Spo0J family partition protein [Nesterenkonia massiliensis]|uniref:ParB/RepB/Spo0J family partition protein n=1 Tax=Nesterenkonia massiliensis TaxID=1232429 RepID=A0ABT2HTK5_9MICC|nr:ParB/RepB/Spo0J family partition protein [Nesterenkonia massiliensis]MCT1608026.1 ParB/RepB/Spo0J family partition protein [Nesterenkonia massiliensis]